MNAVKYSLAFSPAVSNLSTRAVVFALVISAHVAVLTVWSSQPNANAETNNELSVNFSMTAQATQAAAPKVKPPPPQISPIEPLPVVERIPEQAAISPAPQPPAVAEPGVAPAVTEPDYKAAYLNNPAPLYPMVARRNGLQGRVLLSVEVLADGVCGQISIQKSSGYAMLDNAALQTVKSWRFVPARQGGHAVDKWFMIPVQFSLKDNAA